MEYGVNQDYGVRTTNKQLLKQVEDVQSPVNIEIFKINTSQVVLCTPYSVLRSNIVTP